jgi:magnesium-transporting ATPase (P-type)
MNNLLTKAYLLAADTDIPLKPPANSKFSPLGELTVGRIVSGLIQMAMVIAAIVFFFVLVIGGIKWVASGGDKTQTESARNQITAALVGLVIVFAAWAILQLIKTFFGIDIFSLSLPSA